ncbi:hypothetical protein LCGC14_1770370 [marine sediment metagenome]|uniref:histidine kinase n=1 Tax=marine sediment metagenome TaxID=412755 RepID=A0A0F9JDG0_9ZZZZ
MIECTKRSRPGCIKKEVHVKHITDIELVSEINRRLDEYNKALHDLKTLTRKLEQVNRKLQESEATKSNFLSNIRNEINNPLTSIMGLSRQLVSGDLDKSETLSVALNIFHEAFDLDFQLNNIFMAAEIEAGESPVGVSNIEIGHFIDRIINAFSHKIKDKDLSVKFDCEGGPELVFKTDPLKLRAIVMNLIANAVEFSIEGKPIRISAKNEDGRLVIAIADEGVGIANEEKELIFDRFRQIETGTQKSHRGHGLGLSVVKSLLNQMGGDIDFSCIAGQGCTFTVSVPEFVGDTPVDEYSEEGNEFIFGKEEEF